MFFLSLMLFLFSSWFAPWWMSLALSLAMGWIFRPKGRDFWSISLSCALASMALAYTKDSRQLGLVAKRIGALLNLPSLFLFALVGALAFVSAALWLRAGIELHNVSLKSGKKKLPR